MCTGIQPFLPEAAGGDVIVAVKDVSGQLSKEKKLKNVPPVARITLCAQEFNYSYLQQLVKSL